MVDSRDDPRVQVADLLAGVARRLPEIVDDGPLQPFLSPTSLRDPRPRSTSDDHRPRSRHCWPGRHPPVPIDGVTFSTRTLSRSTVRAPAISMTPVERETGGPGRGRLTLSACYPDVLLGASA